ncbi:MAG: transposase [Sandaracinaceae bacterium]
MSASGAADVGRPRLEVGDIARAHGPALVAAGVLRLEQRRALRAMTLCRTADLGGHLDVCHDCGHERPSYNSCRNRHCPKCQAGAQHRWLEARRERLLPVHYFHVVFTVPAELRALFRRERRLLCGLLMRTAAATLQDVADDERLLGAQLGITAVLHTWSRDLSWHPHVHCVVTGGGLRPDGTWRSTRPGFLFPVRVLGRVFRGKLLASLERLRTSGRLELEEEDPEAWSKLRNRLYAKDWIVYAKRPFAGVDSVYAYLGRYTHRIGLSNRRLLAVDHERVTFATRYGKRATSARRLPATLPRARPAAWFRPHPPLRAARVQQRRPRPDPCPRGPRPCVGAGVARRRSRGVGRSRRRPGRRRDRRPRPPPRRSPAMPSLPRSQHVARVRPPSSKPTALMMFPSKIRPPTSTRPASSRAAAFARWTAPRSSLRASLAEPRTASCRSRDLPAFARPSTPRGPTSP